MAGIDIDELSLQVKKNCDISDAIFWGNYSICGLLLSLRGLFRQEKKIDPWEGISHGTIAEWISSRERLWQELEGGEFINLTIGGKGYMPFDVGGINRSLEAEGLLYGAGLGVYRKPSFFLAELHSKESAEGYEVSISGDEFVRDLSIYPAVLQDNAILARREALATLLWDKYEEVRLKRHGGALSYAFSQYGMGPDEDLSESLYARISEVAKREINIYVRHEIGEAFEGEILGERWKELLCGPLNRRVETFVRSVKDVLSDTSEKGMLKYIIDNESRGSFGFYLSLLGGFRTMIFPEARELFPAFIESEDWELIEKARRKGYRRAGDLASRVLEFFRLKESGADEAIERELIDKLQQERI